MKQIFSTLCVFIALAFVDNAAAFYNCIDSQGNPIIRDNPPPGAKCEYMGGQRREINARKRETNSQEKYCTTEK